MIGFVYGHWIEDLIIWFVWVSMGDRPIVSAAALFHGWNGVVCHHIHNTWYVYVVRATIGEYRKSTVGSVDQFLI